MRHSGPLNWILIQIQKFQKCWLVTIRMDGSMEILSCQLGYLSPRTVDACAARNYGPHHLITKKRRVWPGGETEIHIISTGPNWGFLDPSLGYKVLLYRLYCRKCCLRPHALRTITGCTFIITKKRCRKPNRKTEIQIERQECNLNWSPPTSLRSQYGDKCITKL